MSHMHYADKVWLNEDCKWLGICDEVESAFIRHQTTLNIAYFEDTRAQLEEAFQARTIPYQPYTGYEVEPGTPLLALARDLQRTAPLATAPSRPTPFLVIIAEHHPLLKHDEELLQALAALPCADSISFHCALNDPLLARFGSETIQKLFKQLGADEHTPLSHTLISSALQKAQAKIGKKVTVELGVRSAQEWFQLNLPEEG